MDNKEAIARIKNKRDRIFTKLGKVAIVDALDLAIKSMKQVDALNKIKAEIKEESRFCPFTEGLERALEIIDKHTAEEK